MVSLTVLVTDPLVVAFAFLLQYFEKVVGTYKSYFVSLPVQFE